MLLYKSLSQSGKEEVARPDQNAHGASGSRKDSPSLPDPHRRPLVEINRAAGTDERRLSCQLSALVSRCTVNVPHLYLGRKVFGRLHHEVKTLHHVGWSVKGVLQGINTNTCLP